MNVHEFIESAQRYREAVAEYEKHFQAYRDDGPDYVTNNMRLVAGSASHKEDAMCALAKAALQFADLLTKEDEQ